MPWTYRDVSKRVPWGKLRSLHRIDAYLGDILQRLKSGDTSGAVVIVTQLKKAMHQVALDGGDWRTGALMVPVLDPLGRSEFGGAEAEIEVISAYKRAMQELHRGHKFVQQDRETGLEGAAAEGGEGAAPEGGAGRPPRGRGRGKG